MVFMGFYTFFMLKGLYLLFNVYIHLKKNWAFVIIWLCCKEDGINYVFFFIESQFQLIGFEQERIPLFSSFLGFVHKTCKKSTLHGF